DRGHGSLSIFPVARPTPASPAGNMQSAMTRYVDIASDNLNAPAGRCRGGDVMRRVPSRVATGRAPGRWTFDARAVATRAARTEIHAYGATHVDRRIPPGRDPCGDRQWKPAGGLRL